MIGDPIDLDDYRGLAARRAADIRRHRHDALRAQAASLRRLQEELEELLLEAPANSWSDVVPKARYLIRLFAATPEAQEPLRMQLIADTLNDLTWLYARRAETSKPDLA